MSYEVVHTFGSTTYFLFAVFFLWIKGIPRINAGAGWWAASIACALAARIILFLFLPSKNAALVIAVYVAFNVLEKPLFLTGLVRFLELDTRLAYFWLAGVIAEVWIVVGLLADWHPLIRASLYSLINSGLLACAGWFAFYRTRDYPRLPMRCLAVSSILLSVHWLTGPVLSHFSAAYFRNGFVIGTLLVSIQYFALVAAILTLFQRRVIASEAQALDLACHDPLTGLNNKRYMGTLFEQALLLATRPHQVVAVFYIDLDNFKPINDTAGHAVGDEVLKRVASRLKENTRSTDICVRIGGDEFVVIGTQLDNEEQALEIGNKLLKKIIAEIEIDGQTYGLGASIGIALYPRHGHNLDDLMKCADSAMYLVKRNGKNSCAIYQAQEEGGKAQVC
ncbi:GGDEF domain-containing protein [Rugamonas rivuli]|uniref:Diguanylate cyclase n=1 Tax=Rugamonas rivuli TaxID=2743358 RepID=A0A843SI81_9BURK|nr:GGDEF domain-containing protein [Rugamonas rivuli]MQA22992.1 diguanylate cyclase [Rugamonas rivuli]